MTRVATAAATTPRPRLVFITSTLSGQCRRVEGFLAQVLQRRRNHGTFHLLVVDEDTRPDLLRRFGIESLPTLVVVDGRAERGRIEQPRGCRQIEQFLSPWLR